MKISNGTVLETDAGEYVAGWNKVLTNEEIALIAKGISPTLVATKHLVFYAPLLRAPDGKQRGVEK